jgi:hypothetical protein
MLMQRSMFTIHDDATSLDDLLAGKNAIVKKVIRAADKVQIRHEIKVLAFDRRHLFPDLQNLSRSLNESDD